MFALAEKSVELNKPRVFVVDDEPEVLHCLKLVLLDSGNDVFPFSNGAAALEAVVREPADIFLLDISMPEMDGIQLCERIKQNLTLKDIPVIFLSGLKSTENLIRGFRAGGVDFITKPFLIDEIQARIGAHINRGRAEALLRQQNEYLEQIVVERTSELRMDI